MRRHAPETGARTTGARAAGRSMVVRDATLAWSTVLIGCVSAGTPPLVGPPRTQPAALVGRWLPADASDARGTTPVLVLHESARAWEESGAPAARHAPIAWWWVYAADDATPARLCVGWRPGRHAAACLPFAMDSSAGYAARRLTWGTRRYALDAAPPAAAAR